MTPTNESGQLPVNAAPTSPLGANPTGATTPASAPSPSKYLPPKASTLSANKPVAAQPSAFPTKAATSTTPAATGPSAAPKTAGVPAAAGVKAATPKTAGAPVRGALSRPFSAKRPERLHGSKKFLFDLLNGIGSLDPTPSDIHVHPERGIWVVTNNKPVKSQGKDTLIAEEDVINWMTHSEGYEDMGVKNPEELLGEKGHTTVAFDTGVWRVRGSFRRSTVGVSCTFRLIPAHIPSVEDVYLPQMMIDMIRRRSGLILIEGPTGSGKTTSIAALIDYINANTDAHIYSIEDPIEFYHEPKGNTVFTMREVGVHATDYPSAVENALRSKPNIIFVGEMLNNATKKAALHASTTGHLVITTAHAGSVTEALDSFIGEFPADEQTQIRSRLATSLLGVMCQTLVPTKTGSLVAAREIMTSNINFVDSIRNGKMNMVAAQMESGENCQSLENALLELVQKQVIDVTTAIENAKRPEVIRQELNRLGLLATD